MADAIEVKKLHQARDLYRVEINTQHSGIWERPAKASIYLMRDEMERLITILRNCLSEEDRRHELEEALDGEMRIRSQS